MKILAATLVAAALLATTVACDSEGSDDSAPTAGPPSSSTTEPTTEPTTETSSSEATPSTDPPDADPDGDGFGADDGVVALTTTARGATCFDGDKADYGWFNVQWKSHADLDAVRFRLSGNEGVRAVGSPTTIPPVNFGGRIDYAGMVDWADQSPLVSDRFLDWGQRDDADFLSPIEDQTGLLLFHLRFPPSTVAGEQKASLGDLVATYTRPDETTGTVTLALDQTYRFAKKRC